MAPTLRVGAAQIAPKSLDKVETLKKTLQVIGEAGRRGLDLLVFPETYISAYPYWRGSISVRRSTELIVQMQRGGLRIPGPETEELAAARRARVNCVIGCNELDDRPGSLRGVRDRAGSPRGRLRTTAQLLFHTHSDLFEEVAKYRAMRRLWARLMRDRFGAKDPRSWHFRFGVVCGGSTLTRQEPLNNVVRVAYQALASVLGGAQTIFTCAWDEAIAIPTEASALLALKTQQILAYETNVPVVVDPLGEAAAGPDNLMPSLLKAAAARATIGEMVARLRQVFGEFREPRMF